MRGETAGADRLVEELVAEVGSRVAEGSEAAEKPEAATDPVTAGPQVEAKVGGRGVA